MGLEGPWLFVGPLPPDLKARRAVPHQALCSQSLPNCSGLLSGSLQLLAQGCPVDTGVRLSEAQDRGLSLPSGNSYTLHYTLPGPPCSGWGSHSHTCFQCLPQGPVVLRCPLLFFLQL